MWLSQELLGPNKTQAPLEAGEAPCEFIGEEVQRLSVVQNLPQLLEGNEQLCMQRVVPKVQLALPNASTEFHMAASSTFKTILEKKLVHPRTFTQTFLQSILSSIDSRDPVVANAWLETLLDVIDLLPADVVKADLLPIAVHKAQISQKVVTRITACKLLGKISTRFDQQTLKKDTLPVVLALCQDVKAEVRACICSQLPFIAQGLGADGVRPSILPILVELSSDEESVVRLASVEAIVCMLPHLQPDTLKNTIVPLVKKMCESSFRNEDNVMVVLAQVFGELCLGLENSFVLAEKRWFLSYYQQLAELGLRASDRDFGLGHRNMPDVVPMTNNADKFVECRHHCAFHFPAMTLFAANTPDNFEDILYTVFCGLASDPYFEVRRTIACGMHEVAQVLGSNNGIIKADLVKLLRDDSEEVLQGLIPNLSKALILLTKSDTIRPDAMDSATLEIGRALLKCESEVSLTNNWRLHEMVIQQLECLHQVLPSDFIHSHFTPMFFTKIHTARQLPVRLAATRTLLVMLRYNTKALQKNDIRSRIISELCNGRSCYSRLAYMKLCGQALELFSKKYFKEHFYLPLLDRAEDRVPNIRLLYVRLLPQLKSCLRMPSDKKYFAALEASIRKLVSHEKDKDVLNALEKSLIALDKIECIQDSAQANVYSSKEDQDDMKKVEEETRLALVTMAKHTDTKQGNTPVGIPSGPMTSRSDRPGRQTGLTRGQPTARYNPGSNSIVGMPGSAESKKKTISDRISAERSSSPSKSLMPLRSGEPLPMPSRSAPLSLTNNTSRLSASGRPRNTSNTAVSSPPSSKDSLKSLEEEFYRDAGIKIPQQFASSPLPSRIPNLREMLFKNQHTSEYSNVDDTESVGKLRGDETNLNTECSESVNLNVGRTVSNVDVSGFTKNTQVSNSAQKALSTKLATPKKSVSSSNIQRQEAEKSSSKSTMRSPGTIANRRHSYMAGEKMLKTSLKIEENSGAQKRTTSVIDNSRRHSYIERLQITTQDVDPKSHDPSHTSQSKRLSFVGKEQQSYRNQVTKPAIPLRKSLNSAFQNTESKPDAANRRRSLNFTQMDRSQRGSSVGGERTESSDNTVKRRSLITPSAVSKFGANRRHSSLERDDLEKGTSSFGGNRTYGAGYSNRRSQSPRLSKEDLRYNCSPAKDRTFSSDESLFKTKMQRPGFVFKNEGADKIDYSDEIDFVRHNRLSKIPRSNNSSPGNSRSSSPSSSVGGLTRGRHLTAPNSRAGSPTAASKRLSLGTLNSYMSNIKLTEPSSKLPVRKK